MKFLALPEPEHEGCLVLGGRRAMVVDPPVNVDTTTEFLPAWIRVVAVVETTVPADRIAGGRLLAAELDAPLYGPGDRIRRSQPLRNRGRIAGFPEALALAAPGRDERDIALLVEKRLLVGDLGTARWAPSADASRRVADTRSLMARRHPAVIIHSGAGTMTAGDLATLPPPPTGRPPLNAVAIDLTNRGEADMYWADPRAGKTSNRVDAESVRARLGSPWAPTIVDLRAGGDDIDGARRMAPARLASALHEIGTGREVVVVGEDLDQAGRAAGFLVRLGMMASYADW